MVGSGSEWWYFLNRKKIAGSFHPTICSFNRWIDQHMGSLPRTRRSNVWNKTINTELVSGNTGFVWFATFIHLILVVIWFLDSTHHHGLGPSLGFLEKTIMFDWWVIMFLIQVAIIHSKTLIIFGRGIQSQLSHWNRDIYIKLVVEPPRDSPH